MSRMISSRWLTRDTSSWRSSCSLCCWVDDFCQSAGQTSRPRARKRQFTLLVLIALPHYFRSKVSLFMTPIIYILHTIKGKMHFNQTTQATTQWWQFTLASWWRCCSNFAFFFFHWTEYFFHHCELLTFDGHHDPQLSVQQLKPPLQILLLLPADTVRHQINTRVCVRCVWCVWVSALTAAPGCPVCVSERSSCSPEWTTPESASPPRHGHFLFQQEIWRTVGTQLDLHQNHKWDDTLFI